MKAENRLKPSIVYCAINSHNKEKYVGVTHKSLEHRIKQHRGSITRYNGHFQRAIRKYGFETFNWYTLSKWGNYRDALEEEKRVIALVKPEYNMTIGGEGAVGLILSAEQRKKIRASRPEDQAWKKVICLNDGMVFLSIKKAAEHYGVVKHRISTVLKEKEISVNGLFFAYYSDDLLNIEKREKLLEALKSRKSFSKFNSSAVLSKPVMCLNDSIIYPSILKASEFYNISAATIKNSCIGRHKSKSGFHFKYLENEDDNIVRENFVFVSPNRKKVLCIEDNKVFDSICDAARFYGASDGNIGMVLKGKRSHTKGKTFEYVENV